MYKTVYCALLSCFEHASDHVHVHMLIDESVAPYKHWLEELCASFQNPVTFYENVEVPDDVVNTVPRGRCRQLHQGKPFPHVSARAASRRCRKGGLF